MTTAPEYNFTFQLVVKRHPDGELELETYGNTMINVPLLQMFLALHEIRTRLVSYRLFIPVAVNMPNWEMLTPKLQTLVEYAAKEQNHPLKFSVIHADEQFTYVRPMHFIFKIEEDWIKFITPRNVETDLYGSDHGMYEHVIVLEPDLWQRRILERLLSKWGIEYQPIYDQDLDGFMVHRRKNTLSAYDERGGFLALFQKEIANLFTEFAKTQPADYQPPALKFETI